MRVDRVSYCVYVCSLACFAIDGSVLIAEEVADQLNEAHDRYEQNIEQIEQEAITRLDELISRYSDEGNLQKVLELRAQKTKLLEDRAWPESVVFRTMREKIRSSRARAKRELAAAYEDAIATLTKERKYDDAVALREELEELTEIQAAFDFRSEEPQRKKPDREPADRQVKDAEPEPTKKTAKPKPPLPARPQKAVVGKPSDSGLTVLLSSRAALVLDNPLITSEQKQDGLINLFRDFATHLPPRQWTPQQLDEVVGFFAAVATKVDTLWLPTITLDETTRAVSLGSLVSEGGSADNKKRWAAGRSGMLWLLCSPSPKEFIGRANHLKAKDYWSVIDKQTTGDDLKLWMQSMGCNDSRQCAALVNTLREGGVQLSAINAISAELGE